MCNTLHYFTIHQYIWQPYFCCSHCKLFELHPLLLLNKLLHTNTKYSIVDAYANSDIQDEIHVVDIVDIHVSVGGIIVT